MKLNMDLTEGQKAEFKRAEEFGGSSAEIQKHPEWHQNFMNGFWNAEREGKSKDYYQFADYMTSHPSKMDADAGKIGADFEYLYTLHQFMNKAKPAGINVIPDIPLNADGYVDIESAKFMLQNYIHQFVEHREPLYTGRMPIRINDNMDDMKCLMCEGVPEAINIYDQLGRMARSNTKLFDSAYDMSGRDRHGANMSHLILTLDDMNIRGQQIVDAYEYAGDSIEELSNKISVRDPEMTAYVNQKTADRYLNDFEKSAGLGSVDVYKRVMYPIAKDGGASRAHSGHFDVDREWHIDATNADSFARSDVSPMKIDYSKLDIMEGVDVKTGFQIIEARGFEKYFDRTVKNAFGENKQVAFFYNKYNGDIVEVAGAQNDNINYAGTTLKTWRDEANWHHTRHGSSGFKHEAGLGYAEFTYHNGLFGEYDTYNNTPVSEQANRDKLGYQGIGKFPIPDYVHLWCRSADLPDKVTDPENLYLFHSSESYRLEWMIDMMIAPYDPEIKEDICPDYKQLKDDPYHSFMKEHGGLGWGPDMQKRAQMFQLAASYIDMPKEERLKYYNALVDLAEERDNKLLQTAGDDGVRLVNLAGEYVSDLADTYLEDPKCPEDIYALNVPKIEDTPFAEFLPWMDTEVKEFEAAVAGISMEQDAQIGL